MSLLYHNEFSFYILSNIAAALIRQRKSKSTVIINLIERFNDPEVGEVLIDGINLKEIQLE